MKLFGRKSAPAKAEPAAPPPRSILIVDDNPPFRGMLKSMLAMRGYAILTASSAAEGLKLASEYAIDGILVDYDMPGTNGLEFCRMLREQNQAAGRDIPAWIITGALHADVGKHAVDAGAVRVIRKPFNADELCSRLEQEFSNRAGPTAPAA